MHWTFTTKYYATNSRGAVSDDETLTLIQNAARRWAIERGEYWAAQMTPACDDGLNARLMHELTDQGWFASAPDEWGDTPWITLVRLGRTISHQIPAGFLPILSHWLGLQLLAPQLGAHPLAAGPIAASPYLDYSRSRSNVAATLVDGGWVLEGQAYWVINAHPRCRLALVANLSEGTPAVFAFDAANAGCSLGEPLTVLGLWGPPARNVRLSSVRLSHDNLVAEGSDAASLIGRGYRLTRWSALSVLCGTLETFYAHAQTYASARTQGGRKIVDHSAVRQLLDTVHAAIDSFDHLLDRFEQDPEADYAIERVRRQARRACDSALQIFGGIGYVCPGLPERCWRDVQQAATLCSAVLA